MRILILAVNFAPEYTGNAPYVTALAEYLSESHDVTVITGLPHYPDWRVAPEWRHWRRVEKKPHLKVIRLSHYVPSKQDSARRGIYELSWAARALVEGLRHPADVVVGVVPALLTSHVASVLARRHKAGLGLVVQDLMSRAVAQSGIKGGGKSVAGGAMRVERSGLRKATGVCTIHPRFARVLVEDYGVRADSLTVIYNWCHIQPPTAERDATRRLLGWPKDRIVAMHSGNMGLKQDLDNVIAAARLAQEQDAPVHFVIAGEGSQRARLAASAAGVTHLEVRDGVVGVEFSDFLAAADVLLVNERARVLEMSLPSKLTSYLAAGRPVIAATEADSATAELVVASGGGLLTPPANPQGLLDTVLAIGSDSARAEQLGKTGQQFVLHELDSETALADYRKWIEGLCE